MHGGAGLRCTCEEGGGEETRGKAEERAAHRGMAGGGVAAGAWWGDGREHGRAAADLHGRSSGEAASARFVSERAAAAAEGPAGPGARWELAGATWRYGSP